MLALEHIRARVAHEGGEVLEASVERRDIVPSHSAMWRQGNWPWPVRGAIIAADTVCIAGQASEAQVEGLAEQLAHAARAEAWMNREVPSISARPTSQGLEVRLPWTVARGLLLEQVVLWEQAWWAKLDYVELR